jgi:RNA polymerase sigma factor (sigma-70 family)
MWSMVLAAGQARSGQSQEALTELCRIYWYPLYAYLRRNGQSPQDAEDLTQSFFEQLLAHERLERVGREKGRFRSFLLASMRNHLCDHWDKARAQKRGGGATIISLDVSEAEKRYAAEPGAPLDPERIFERRWALTLLDRVLGRLETEFASSGKKEKFDQLHGCLLGDPAADTYAQIGERIGMSEGAVKVAVLRLRQRYRELFRIEIAETVGAEDEIEEEMRHVFTVLSS